MPMTVSMWNDEMAELVEQVWHTIVQITGRRGNLGTGVVWSGDGLIVTNAHVVYGDQVTVILANGEQFAAQVAATAERIDVAVLRIDAAGLQAINRGDSRAVRAGHWAIAVGHPFGVLGSATAGTVIGISEGLPESGGNSEWIALNLRLRPGHSGGPLIDAAGRMIGMNTLITGPEVGFAIPVHVIEAFVDEQGRRGETVQV
jgi:serine protease Do